MLASGCSKKLLTTAAGSGCHSTPSLALKLSLARTWSHNPFTHTIKHSPAVPICLRTPLPCKCLADSCSLNYLSNIHVSFTYWCGPTTRHPTCHVHVHSTSHHPHDARWTRLKHLRTLIAIVNSQNICPSNQTNSIPLNLQISRYLTVAPLPVVKHLGKDLSHIIQTLARCSGALYYASHVVCTTLCHAYTISRTYARPPSSNTSCHEVTVLCCKLCMWLYVLTMYGLFILG